MSFQKLFFSRLSCEDYKHSTDEFLQQARTPPPRPPAQILQRGTTSLSSNSLLYCMFCISVHCGHNSSPVWNSAIFSQMPISYPQISNFHEKVLSRNALINCLSSKRIYFEEFFIIIEGLYAILPHFRKRLISCRQISNFREKVLSRIGLSNYFEDFYQPWRTVTCVCFFQRITKALIPWRLKPTFSINCELVADQPWQGNPGQDDTKN